MFAAVAQLVEQLIRNQQVAGSNPASSSKKHFEKGVLNKTVILFPMKRHSAELRRFVVSVQQ